MKLGPTRMLLLWLFAQALRAYPQAFRELFEDEMRADFRRALLEAPGLLAVLELAWRETREWPVSVVSEHWQGRGRGGEGVNVKDVRTGVVAASVVIVPLLGFAWLFRGQPLLIAMGLGVALFAGLEVIGAAVRGLAPVGPIAPVGQPDRPWSVIYRFGVMATLLVALTVFRAARAVLSDGRLANLIETALYVAAIGAFLAYAAQLAALRWHGRVAVWAGLSGVVGVALLMGAVPAPDRFLVGVLVAQAALAAAVWRLWGRGHASRAWEALVGLVLTAIVASWLLVPEAALVQLPDGVRWPLELGQYLVAPLSLVILLAAQLHRIVRARSKPAWSARLLAGALALILLATLAGLLAATLAWDQATDGIGMIGILMIAILPGALGSAVMLGWALPGRRKIVAPLFALTILAITSQIFATRSWVSSREWTVARAEALDAAIRRYGETHGRFPATLEALGLPYTTRLFEPIVFRQESWCYEAGADFYRFGYLTQPTFGVPADMIEIRIQSAEGEPPQAHWACDDRLDERREAAPR
ncbi:MAG TPA: hypothetical protein PLC98_12265 [Anaerolineales bacterium]|nr:hypothetical protein [Anaerolineales bacterium]